MQFDRLHKHILEIFIWLNVYKKTIKWILDMVVWTILLIISRSSTTQFTTSAPVVDNCSTTYANE